MAINSLLYSAAISSGTLPAAEGVIATANVAVGQYCQYNRVRVRGHVNVTGNATAGTITVRVRQGLTTAGAQVYTSGAIPYAISATGQIVFEFEDDSGWINQAGSYVVTGVDSAGAGTVNGGYLTVEAIP